LLSDLRALPMQPEVRAFQSLYGDSEPLSRFQPDVLMTALHDEAAEEVGALRLLRSLWPALAVVLVTDAANELGRAPLAGRIGAHVLVHPGKPGQLAATIDQALLGSDRPRPDVFLDLAHGIADEINNPLLFVSGHLQLLRASFEPQRERDRRDQVTTALEGLRRIQDSVERLRLVAMAANGPRRPGPVDLAELVAAAAAAEVAAPGLAPLAAPAGPCLVTGDRDQLAAAMRAVVQFRGALAAAGTPSTLVLQRDPRAVRLRLVAAGSGLASWRLPHTFEPYYPNRILRGHGHGLSLFVAQTVVHGHRGQATARRLADGSLQFDFVLPAPPSADSLA
jgi:signal transduction histidine kinase